MGTLCLSLAAMAAVAVSCSTARRSASREGERHAPLFERADSTPTVAVTAVNTPPPDSLLPAAGLDTLPAARADSTAGARADTMPHPAPGADSLPPRRDSAARPAAPRAPRKFLDAPVKGHADDSLVYDARRRFLFHYKKSELAYMDNDLKADYIVVNAVTKEVLGAGMPDSVGVLSRPDFTQGGTNYTMDSVVYNMGTRKALVKGGATKDGEGFMTGRVMKRQSDGSIDMADARYTTCDHVEHPHFYIAMTKSKVVPGKKVIIGPAYFVMEDVKMPFFGVPGGFFPLFAGPTSGLIMPQYGEEASRGFYFRGGGYYFTFGDHVDLKLTADIYTLGSWGVSAQSNYVKRYKYRGTFSTTYNKLIYGSNAPSNQFNVMWNHSQDPKANPWRTFSANVNFSTAGQKQMATTSLQDHLNTSTTSSVQYSRRWELGTTTLSLNANFSLGTSSADSTVSITLPNISLGLGSFAPLKRKNPVGKERWYEKITMSYSMNAMNQAQRIKERDFFGDSKNPNSAMGRLQNGISHSIPIKTSFNLLKYINFSPSFNYNEVWNFQRRYRVWEPAEGTGTGRVRELDPEYGFFRTYGWNVNGSLSTKIYGTYQAKSVPGKVRRLQAMRHTITPTVGFSYAPDFSHPRYGFLEYVQNNASGAYQEYSPNQGSPGPLGAGGPQASINFSLSNRFEIKLVDRADSTKKKNVVIIEQFSLGSSYNFLMASKKDKFPLGTFPISLRSGELFKGFAIQLNGTWDPYTYINDGGTARRVNRLAIGGGKFGRITQSSWSFGKTFSSKNAKDPDPASMNGAFVTPYNDPYDLTNGLDPATRRQYMVRGYYDFDIPWSFTFNYNVGYSYTGLKPQITQTLSFNGSVTLGKWGTNFNSGYDFTRRKLSHMQLNFARDLHCWEMTFSWVPMGRIKSYTFHIGIKSGMLRDIKYDKSSNMYDTLMR